MFYVSDHTLYKDLHVVCLNWQNCFFFTSDGETQFYVFSEDTPIDVDSLAAQRELLVTTQPLKPVLDRSPMVSQGRIYEN